MSKVLLTGATGFLGSYVARLLISKGHEVTAIHRAQSSFDLVQEVKNEILWVECELTDLITLEDLIQETDYIVHCAALISWQAKDRKALYTVNVRATHDLVNLALLHPVKKFVHISSIAALGKSDLHEEYSEESEWVENEKNTDYGITKHLAELEIKRGEAEGLHTLILNPSLILGAGHWDRGTSALFNKLNRWNPFHPKGSTGMVDVRDVAELVVKGMESELVGMRILATGHDLSYKTLISSISKALGQAPPKVAVSSLLMRILPFVDAVMCFFTRKERTVSRSTLLASSSQSRFSNEKSKTLLNHKYLSFEKTIFETAEAFRRSKDKNLSYGLLSFENPQ